ncbi:MAG: Na+/H+ antiporter NhaA [Actinomycetales bacterium]|nr:Na+/H+ antiporter NhaA [Actinomycetales bacterium]
MTDHELFARPALSERVWLLRALRGETIGGVLLLIAAVIAIAWANSPWGDAYTDLGNVTIGPAALGLDLSLSTWAADALLAVFFFVAGLELKHEFTHGTLSRPAQAAVPIAAAIGGMAIPAVIFTIIVATGDPSGLRGWAVPMATDIAFALAVLAVVGRGLPIALRAFLLTLAVVDDLGAITIIAIFYSKGFSPGFFALAIVLLAAYWLLQRRRVRSPWIYVPLVIVTWWAVYMSGIHATVAGVALALLTRSSTDPGESESPVDRLQRMLLPWSAGLCVPLFAFFAAGVDLRSTGLIEPLTSPVAIGVLAGLIVGKPLGVIATALIVARFTRASLNPAIGWRDILAVGILAGIGFTVALLITELAYSSSPGQLDAAKVAVFSASVASALLASAVLLSRNRHYRRVALVEEADVDGDGIPDVYQREVPGDPGSRPPGTD